MALSRESIADAALGQVQEAGLSSLSMRGVATVLGVRPGALYWHVESKQELLALLAARILAAEPFADGGVRPDGRDAARLAADLRTSLLAVRDGAEIVSFARALHPGREVPVEPIRLAILSRPDPAAGPDEALWAASALVHFVLGFVAEEQNRAELTRAGLAESAEPAGAGRESDAFEYGVRVILDGAALRR